MAVKPHTGPVEVLSRFVEQVADLRTRRVIQNMDLRSTMTIKGSTEQGVQFEHHEPDEEDQRSYLLDFRKFMSADEPVFLNR